MLAFAARVGVHRVELVQSEVSAKLEYPASLTGVCANGPITIGAAYTLTSNFDHAS